MLPGPLSTSLSPTLLPLHQGTAREGHAWQGASWAPKPYPSWVLEAPLSRLHTLSSALQQPVSSQDAL